MLRLMGLPITHLCVISSLLSSPTQPNGVADAVESDEQNVEVGCVLNAVNNGCSIVFDSARCVELAEPKQLTVN